MDNLTKQLLDTLNEHDPDWKEQYGTTAKAAEAAGCVPLYQQWRAKHHDGVPDYAGAAKRAAEAEKAQPSSLPFGYGNMGWLPASAWDRDGGGNER